MNKMITIQTEIRNTIFLYTKKEKFLLHKIITYILNIIY